MAQSAPSSSDSFPSPSTFAHLLNSEVRSMGFRRALASSEESSIVSFIYEAFRNSWEHGRSSDASRRARSTRALIIEKIVLQSGDLESRHLSDDLKSYLDRVAESNKGGLGLGVICFSIADQGDGIQTTLPLKDGAQHETPIERLARAFIAGESRKPVGIVQRGLGLPNVVSAAHSLQALMRVASGNLTAEQDFSLSEDKYPRLNLKSIKQLSDDVSCGTCMTLFVPEFAFDLDQRSLFTR
jgi:hypothetical protein